jgi:type 1 fimbria pilin
LISNKSTTGAATNVALQLQDSNGNAIPVTTTATKYATGVTLDTAGGSKDVTFKVKYYSTAATPTSGAVTGDLIVNWSYQ